MTALIAGVWVALIVFCVWQGVRVRSPRGPLDHHVCKDCGGMEERVVLRGGRSVWNCPVCRRAYQLEAEREQARRDFHNARLIEELERREA